MRNNKILCMLIVLSIIFTYTGSVLAEKNTDAYQTMYFIEADEHSSGLSKNTKYNCLGIAKKEHYVLYKNVDFGNDTAGFIDISYAVIDKYTGGTMNVYADSMTEDNICAEITTVSTGSWTEFSTLHTPLLKGLTGTHDIYFEVTSDYFGNLRSFNFTNNSAEQETAAAEFTEKINSADVDEYAKIFSEYAEILELDTSEFDGGEDFVYGYIKNNTPYTDFSAFKVAFTNAVLLLKVNRADDAEALKNILKNNPELISSANSDFVQSYKTMEQTAVLDIILEAVRTKEVNSNSEFSALFNNAVCEVLYKACDSQDTLGAFLKKYKTYLSLDKYTEYETMSERSQNNILNAVFGSELDELNAAFSNAYAAEVKRLSENIRSAYDEINLIDADFMSDGLTKNTSFSCISNTWAGKYLTFNELNFGDKGAKAIDFTYGATAQYTGEIVIYIDSISTGNEIASLITKDTGDWHTWETETVPLSKSITGVHDVYVLFGAVVGDVKSMQFYTSKLVNVSDISVKLYKSDTETENISEADKIAVSGNVEVINDGSTTACLIANVYDENMTPLMPYMISKSVLQSGAENNFSLEKALLNGISPVSANAFIIDDSYIIYGKPTFLGAYIP